MNRLFASVKIFIPIIPICFLNYSIIERLSRSSSGSVNHGDRMFSKIDPPVGVIWGFNVGLMG